MFFLPHYQSPYQISSKSDKNTEVISFHFLSIFVGRAGMSKIVEGILNSFYVVFAPLLTPIPNFIQIGQKTRKLEIFTFGQSWLVGLVGRKMVVGISNLFYVIFAPLLASIPNFIKIRQKTQKLEIFTFGRFWLVGLVGRKMVAATSNIQLLPGRL